MSNDKRDVSFSDLSLMNKIGMIGGWSNIVFMALGFIIGFMGEMV